MRVVATAVGFYRGARRRVGDIFEMSEAAMKRNANEELVLPKWVEKAPADEAEAKQKAADAKAKEEKKNKAGALAASGGKVAKDKTDATQDLV